LIQVKAVLPRHIMIAAEENAMPMTSIVFLAGTVAAFIVFAAALAWGEYQTGHLDRRAQRQSPAAGAKRLPDSIVRNLGDQASVAARGSSALNKVTD
jgi:hypothetical protein